MKFTLSVRSFQVPPTPFTTAWPPSFPSVPTSRATRVTSEAKEFELVHHGVDGVFQFENLAAYVDRDFLRQIAFRNRGGHFSDVAHLIREVRCHEVHVVCQVLPGPAHAFHFGLAAQLSFRSHFAATRITSEVNVLS